MFALSLSHVAGAWHKAAVTVPVLGSVFRGWIKHCRYVCCIGLSDINGTQTFQMFKLAAVN